MDKSTLRALGLTSNEIEIYLVLLETGEATASELARKTGFYRQICYDALDRLLEKGFASFVSREGKKRFQAAPPQKLLEYAEEKKEQVARLLPELEKISQKTAGGLSVEVYQGRQVVKLSSQEIINSLKRHGGISRALYIDEGKYTEEDGPTMARYQKQMEKLGFHEKVITFVGATTFLSSKNITYRALPKEYFNPHSTLICPGLIALIVWGPPRYLIIIRNKEIAAAHRQQFDLLWQIAKPVRKKQRGRA